MRDAILGWKEREELATAVEGLLEKLNPHDVLSVIAIVGVNATRIFKDTHDQRRAGILFLKEFGLLDACWSPADAAEKTARLKEPVDDGGDAAATDCSGELGENEHGFARLEEWESVMISLNDCCAEHKYEGILAGVPAGVGTILRDYPKERDRDRMVLETIACSVIRRSEVRSDKTNQIIQRVAEVLKAVTESIDAIRGNRIRDAAILKAIETLTQLAHL